jgi:ABC-type transport system involved in multi-copper enzyme maturation permease subunit
VISGLLRKTVRETWRQTVLLCLALFTVEVLLTALLPKLQAGLNNFLATIPFIRTFLQALLGSDLGDNVTAQALQGILWTHPVVLTIVWAHEILLCTRVPAGEIDRGSIDILLSWPASRFKILLCEAIVWLVSGVLLLALAFVGHMLSAIATGAETTPAAARTLVVLLNLYGVYLAVGGFACFVSACSDYRGRALAAVFAVLLASFFVSFVVQIWPAASLLVPLGILSYYRPTITLATGNPAWSNMLWLAAVGASFWLAASIVFSRRNICTV